MKQAVFVMKMYTFVKWTFCTFFMRFFLKTFKHIRYFCALFGYLKIKRYFCDAKICFMTD